MADRVNLNTMCFSNAYSRSSAKCVNPISKTENSLGGVPLVAKERGTLAPVLYVARNVIDALAWVVAVPFFMAAIVIFVLFIQKPGENNGNQS